MRDKPDDADSQSWLEFDLYADEHGIGEEPEDWADWWDIWQAAWDSSARNAGSIGFD